MGSERISKCADSKERTSAVAALLLLQMIPSSTRKTIIWNSDSDETFELLYVDLFICEAVKERYLNI